MASGKNDDSKFPVAGLLILVTVVGGIWLSQEPYRSDRPVDEQHGKALVVGDKRVQSRLWQDPFISVEAHKNGEEKSNETKTISLQSLRLLQAPDSSGHPDTFSLKLKVEGAVDGPEAKHHHSLSFQLKEITKSIGESQPKFKVLVVVTEGTPFASGTEYRLRHRYAVVSALGVAGYIPEEGEFFRYFEWDRTNLRDKDLCWNDSCPSLDVPLEWFKRSGKDTEHKEHVLVLWVKDQDLDKKPLESLQNLVGFVKNSVSGSRDSSPAFLSFKVLGPFHSGTLRAMISEVLLKKRPAPPSKKAAEGSTDIQYISFSATASEAVLLEGLKSDLKVGAKEDQFWESMKSLGFDVDRVIGTDEKLARELVTELKKRRVDPETGKDHIALIGEWDTLYGRKLPLTFLEAAHDNPDLDLLTKIKNVGKVDWPDWAHRYSYLRGIDGELPPNGDESGVKAEGGGTEPGNFLGTSPKDLERPEGRAQFDYLRRLKAQIQVKDRKIREECIKNITLKWTFWEYIPDWQNCRGFKAMGILAGDVYDKLLLLQALRKDFPDVIFFTTDLDARLLHPGHYQWTRNLLIASHFGLRLHEKVQRSIPPFRDSYQTSLFLSVLLAIDYLQDCRAASPFFSHGSCDNPPNQYSHEIPPRIFEVGRTGAYDLSAGGNTIHASRPDFENGAPVPPMSLRGFILLGCILLSSVVIYAFISRKALLLALAAKKNPYLWGFLLGIVSLSVWLYVSITNQLPDGEPFVWLEGISVWPTEWLRLLAFFLSLCFLCRGYRALQATYREMKAEFHLTPGTCSGFFEWNKWMNFGRDISGNGVSPKKVNVRECWEVYTSLMGIKCAGSRVAFQTIIYLLLFGVPVFFFLGFPTTPCRGETCFNWDKRILLLSVVTMWLLVFFVVYATRLCGRMVELVLGSEVQWPTRNTPREPWLRSSGNNSLTDIQQSLRFCGQLSEGVGKLIYYPFVVVLVMIVSRFSLFDHWDFPLSLLIVIGSNIGFAIFSAFHFRQSAENARERVLHELSSMMNACSSSTRKAQVQNVIKEVQDFKKGSFCPFGEQPILKAFAIPSGGYVLMILIEYLGK